MFVIPQIINVGFNKRSDTYTGKLAYIIYWDEKGKLRKQPSWESWRDKDIAPQEFNNEPTEGFVLNKKVGGYQMSYNFRQAYTRVYDPRGFEFEITVENLLFILDSTSCIQGKGLTGQFVYGWSGADLWLMPVGAPATKEAMDYSSNLFNPVKITAKSLVVGNTYRFKDETQCVYLGRHADIYNVKSHIFVKENTLTGIRFEKGATNIIQDLGSYNNYNISAYSMVFDHHPAFNKYDMSKSEFHKVTATDLLEMYKYGSYDRFVHQHINVYDICYCGTFYGDISKKDSEKVGRMNLREMIERKYGRRGTSYWNSKTYYLPSDFKPTLEQMQSILDDCLPNIPIILTKAIYENGNVYKIKGLDRKFSNDLEELENKCFGGR